MPRGPSARLMSVPGIHHVELWITDLERERQGWAWLFGELGFVRSDVWSDGETWSAGGSYLTLTTPPTLGGTAHDRRLPGMNHIAFQGGNRSAVDQIMARSERHGWAPLYQERYPHAGGLDHYAGWLENVAGFKVEIVAES